LGHYSSGRDLMFGGKFASSRSHLEAGLALYNPILHPLLVHQTGIHPEVLSQAFLGVVLFCLGFPDQALAQNKAAMAEARRLAHPPSVGTSLALGIVPLSFIGDDVTFGEWVDHLITIATEQDFPVWRAQGTVFRGWTKVKNGDVEDGLSLLRSGLGAYRATGAEIVVPHFLALLARAYEITEQIKEATTQLNEALQIVERTGERWFVAELYRHKGQLLLRQRHADGAEELYHKALSIAQEQEAKLWELRAAVSLARLCRDHGRRGEARDLLAPVYGWFTEGFDTPDLKEAKALLDELNSVREHVRGSRRKPEPADAPRRARSTSIANRDAGSSR